VDGDSIVIDNRMIRLAGIDAPELDHPYGQNAKWTLIRLCKGHVVEARVEGGDHYDRTVATCFLPDGRDLSAEMVKSGMALDWPKFSGGRYRTFEPAGIRKKLWRADARQNGRLPPSPRT
jgi:micrococcal nuclease